MFSVSAPVNSSGTRKTGFFYGYVIVICAFLILAVCFGISYSFGTFFNSLLQEFGWSRAVTSTGFAVSQISAGFAGILSGWFTDRFGPRPTLVVCGISLALGCFLMSLVQNPWQLNIFYGIFAGAGFGGAMIALISTISRWFVRRRGLMTGLAVAGTGFGTTVMPILATALISYFNWRTSFVIISGLAVLVIVPAALFLKRDPSKIGLKALGSEDTRTTEKSEKSTGMTLGEALRTYRFWIIFAAYFFFGFFVQSVMLHIVPHAKALGFEASKAALVISCIGIGSILGRVIMGSISDRIGAKNSMLIAFIMAILVFIWLIYSGEIWMLYIFGVIYGFSYGALITLQSLIGAKQFGLLSLGAIVGTIVFAYTFGGTIGPIATGYIYDVTGSYNLAFIIFTVLSSLSFLLVLIVPGKVERT